MKWNNCGIILASAILISSMFDLCLSYFAYQRDHVYFILHEANREIIPFFVDGVFPFSYFYGVLFLMILIFFLVRVFYEIEEKGFRKQARQLLVCYYWIFAISSLNHVLGGLTWYDPYKVLVIFVNALFIFVFILGIYTGIIGICTVYTMLKNDIDC